MAYYRRVDQRMWGDATFRALSDDAKLLWLRLLTGPHYNGLPGLFELGRLELAEGMRWLPERLDTAFAELVAGGMVAADFDARVVYLPNALKYNRPDSPKNVVGWAKHFDAIPETPLRWRWYSDLVMVCGKLGGEFERASLDAFDTPPDAPSDAPPDGAPNAPCHAERVRVRVRERDIRVLNQGAESDSAPAVKSDKKAKDQIKLQTANRWEHDLRAALLDRGWPDPGAVFDALHSELTIHYEQRGGRWTPTRKAWLAKSLGGYDPEIQLLAIEIYLDAAVSSKDHRYLVGIARRLARLDASEVEKEIKAHRKRNPNGVITELYENQRERA